MLPLLEGKASDLFVAIFKHNISKPSKGLGAQASLTTLSILNPPDAMVSSDLEDNNNSTIK